MRFVMLLCLLVGSTATNLQTLKDVVAPLFVPPVDEAQFECGNGYVVCGVSESVIGLHTGFAQSLTEIPPEISLMSFLRDLDLSSYGFTQLPTEIGTLTSLTHLELKHTTLTSIPDTLGALVQLERLEFQDTQVTYLPTEIGHLVDLTYLDMSNSRVTQIPSEIGLCTSLKTIRASSTRVTTVPIELNNLTNLMLCDFFSQSIVCLPPGLTPACSGDNLPECSPTPGSPTLMPVAPSSAPTIAPSAMPVVSTFTTEATSTSTSTSTSTTSAPTAPTTTTTTATTVDAPDASLNPEPSPTDTPQPSPPRPSAPQQVSTMNEPSDGMGLGAILGIVFGSCAVLLCALALLTFVALKRQRSTRPPPGVSASTDDETDESDAMSLATSISSQGSRGTEMMEMVPRSSVGTEPGKSEYAAIELKPQAAMRDSEYTTAGLGVSSPYKVVNDYAIVSDDPDYSVLELKQESSTE